MTVKFPDEEAASNKWLLLLEKLQEFDLQLTPVGLYGVRDYGNPPTPHPPLQIEWERLLKPTMKSLGCNPTKNWPTDFKYGVYGFQRGAPVDCLRVMRLSKIKVRKYGNVYRVDPHREFKHRWKEAAFDSALNNAWKLRNHQSSLILLIGFADEKSPFGRELSELQSTLTFKQRFQPAHEKMWDDPHGRGFKVTTVLWHVPRAENLKKPKISPV